jgi:hypothetical protein
VLIHEPAVHADEHTSLTLTCHNQYMVDAPEKPSREKIAADWQRQLANVHAAETRYRDACKAKLGIDDVSAPVPVGGVDEAQ